MSANRLNDSNDPRVLHCAANVLARLSTRMLNPPRFPSEVEQEVLSTLQRQSARLVTTDDEKSVALLQRLWVGFYGADEPFNVFSKGWKEMGFQHPLDATSDIRGGGMLSLQALVFIVERHPELVSRMLSRRRDRSVKRGPYSNYPWACAGITLTRKLCEMLQVVVPLSGKPTSAYVSSLSTFWHVAGSAEAFMELFVWTFACLERTWEDSSASYMDFGKVLDATVRRTHDTLQRLPTNVVPTACVASIPIPLDNNHNNEALGDDFCLVESMGPHVARPPLILLSGEEGGENGDSDSDDDDDDDDDDDVMVDNKPDNRSCRDESFILVDDNNVADPEQYSHSALFTTELPAAATADLLGLGDHNYSGTSSARHNNGGASAAFADLDFFGQYGLSD